MKVVAIIIGTLFAAFVAFLALGAYVANTSGGASDSKRETCRQMYQDAAPGYEKRMTRETCERMGVRL